MFLLFKIAVEFPNHGLHFNAGADRVKLGVFIFDHDVPECHDHVAAEFVQGPFVAGNYFGGNAEIPVEPSHDLHGAEALGDFRETHDIAEKNGTVFFLAPEMKRYGAINDPFHHVLRKIP